MELSEYGRQPEDPVAQRRASQRMMALDCAIRIRTGDETAAETVVVALLFIAFLESGA